ncbi:MAG TPA: serine hydrolase [Bryobacteraceae bacterium]|jgi:beta-lactamase class A
MPISRRRPLAATAAGLSGSQALLSERRHDDSDWRAPGADIKRAFEGLPGRSALKIWAPRSGRAREFSLALHADKRLFTASANKSYILCERLRQLDSPHVEEKLVNHALKLDSSIWSLGSTVFNPPSLSGLVSERTAMEAMTAHSDNTATDMVLKEATPKKVRKFLEAIDTKRTSIPDSTRSLAAYLLGATNYLTITWDELVAIANGPLVNPLLNDVQTFASSANDLVSFYARALQGELFRNRKTLQEFRRILSLGDITSLVPFPVGINAFGKAGYVDSPGQHTRCIAGGMYFPDRWVYFAMILNWDTAETDDPETVHAYFRAVRTAIELVRDTLAG